MDKMETSSNASDSPSSNLSSLSGLIGLEEEFYNIKSFLNTKTQPFLVNSINNNYVHHSPSDSFTNVNVELQKVLAINERYKNDLCNLQRKIELANHDKFDKLLKHNLQLEVELSLCYKRITDLTSTGTTTSKQHQTAEYELQQKISETKQCMNRIDHLELLNNALKLECEEAKIDLDTKSTSITGLKKKIVDLHIEIQTLNLDNTKLSNDVHVTRNNYNSLKKSEVWYKEQLHLSRSQKSELAQELTRLRSALIGKEHELNACSNECRRLNHLLNETQNTNGNKQQELPENCSDFYEYTIDSLKTELAALKSTVEAQKDSSHDVGKENGELRTRNFLLNKTVEDKDSVIVKLENERNDLSSRLEIFELKVKDASELLSKTVKEKSEIQVALVEAKREKTDVECAINLLRLGFSKFAQRYNNAKAEVVAANRCKKRLEQEKTELEAINDRLVTNLKDSCAKLTDVESQRFVLHEQLVALQKLLARSETEAEENRRNEAEKREELHALNEKFLEIQRVNESLQIENCQLREQKNNEEAKQKLQNLRCRLKQVEARCKILHRQNLADEEEIFALKQINCFKIEDESECVKSFRALCRAKDLEIKEKREKYEGVYRTLLRKVKEHMRGRNTVEKRYLYLQELHNSVIEELNCCKLEAASNNVELINLQSECRHLRDSDAKSKGEVKRLEKETAEIVVNRDMHEASLRNTIAQLEDEILTCKKELSDKQTLIEQLRVAKDDKEIVCSRMDHEKHLALRKIQELTDSKDELERLLDHEVNVQRDFAQKYSLEQERCADYALQLQEARRMLQQAQMQNDILAEDIKSLSRDFDVKVNELAEVLHQKHSLEIKSKKDEDAVHCLKNDLVTLKSDKYFLQRLCNDLKFALTTTRNQSNVLKKHIQALSVEHSSLPNSLDAPGPQEFDGTYIGKLLQQTVDFPPERALDNLHASLNLLKNEMATLRQQVVENVRYTS